MEITDPRLGAIVPLFGTPRPPSQHNLWGQHGPRCPRCSGWGSTLSLPYAGVTRSASRCTCNGTGLDQDLLLRQQISQLVDRMEKSERDALKKDRRIKALESQLRKYKGVNSRQYWSELIAWTTSDGTAVHTTTTEAILFPNITIPANYMQDGRVLRITAAGKLSTTSTPTMTWALRWNGVAGTILATSEAITMGSGVSNVNWRLQGELQTRTNGATGTLLFIGSLLVHTSSTAVSANVFSVSGYDAPAAVTVDLTADTPLSLTGDWSANSSSNTITGMNYYIESLN